jgi:hypothetical protein
VDGGGGCSKVVRLKRGEKSESIPEGFPGINIDCKDSYPTRAIKASQKQL